eukprot:gb/GECG01006603.1/.p1 GENE.gb/GECG01006603.1/~~gb/GECG01006603.1/.p1  ORF type:complete len:407 (+),score=60.72 gb/GECG01006603.1/:1-1221(+)
MTEFDQLAKLLPSEDGQGGDIKEAMRLCRQMLHENPEDKDLCRTYAYLCIQAKEFANGAKVAGPPTMERAYARYRANQVEDCLQDLAKLETGDSSSAQSILWLKGQAEYRRGNYDAAAKVYEQLIKEEADDPSPEGLANLSAAYAGYGKCTDLASECEDVDTDVQAAIRNGLNNDSYELLFNQSCSSFKSGRPLDCVSLLDKAQQTCISEMQKDGASQEETDEEVSVFLLQKAVLYHKLGFFEDASKLYALVQSKTKDESISSVACANSTLLGGRHAWYEALKQVDHLLNSTTVIQRLTTEQVKQLQLNRLVLLFQLNKKEQCRYAAKELQTRYPESSVPFLVDGLLGTKRKGQKNDSHEDFDFSEAVQKKLESLGARSSIYLHRRKTPKEWRVGTILEALGTVVI